MTDQEPIAAAVLAVLNTAGVLPTGVTAYDLDDVPDSPPQYYVVIDLGRRRSSAYRFGGSNVVPGFRLDTIYRAHNVTTCRNIRQRVCEALEDALIGSYGPFVWNDETQAIGEDPDHGWSGVDTWHFC